MINAYTSVEAYTRPYANLNKTGTRLVRLERQAHIESERAKEFLLTNNIKSKVHPTTQAGGAGEGLQN